jgi:tetratricopeptide (TPR) repeat protein
VDAGGRAQRRRPISDIIRVVRALALILVLASAPTPVSRARELAKEKAWEELYLAYSAGDPGRYPQAERSELSKLLAQGAAALERTDKVMAFSLAERAAVFEETPEGLLLLVRTARATLQRGAAEAALRQGVEKFPQHVGLQLELGRALLEDKDHAEAARVLERIAPRAKEHAEAKKLLSRARAELAREQEALKQAQAVERRIHGGDGPGERAGGDTRTAVGRDGAAPEVKVSGLSYESGVGPGGMRTRGNRRFVFRYFNNQRDFGQRADYEGRVAEALEEAYLFTKRIIGETRESPVDVVLYTREEFMTHHGAGMARAVAGFYRDNAILMNDAGEMTREIRATLVHEYVHAAVDELAGGNARRVPLWVNEGIAEYVEWRYLGSDSSPPGVATALRGAAVRGDLPSLAEMTERALIHQRDPRVAYGTSATAVRLLIKKGGMPKFVSLLKEVGRGRAFEEALQDRYGRTLARLNEEVADELKSR